MGGGFGMKDVQPNGHICPYCGKVVYVYEEYTWAQARRAGGRKTFAHMACLYPKKGGRCGKQ